MNGEYYTNGFNYLAIVYGCVKWLTAISVGVDRECWLDLNLCRLGNSIAPETTRTSGLRFRKPMKIVDGVILYYTRL